MKFSVQAARLVGAWEACGRPFSLSSQDVIAIRQLNDPLPLEVFNSLAELPFQLRLAGEEPLSLAEARTLYDSIVLDTLCNVLSRLKWRGFCSPNELTQLSRNGRGFAAVGSALVCIRELLHAWHCVQPACDAETASLESFGRCNCPASDRSAHACSWARRVTAAHAQVPYRRPCHRIGR